MNTHNFFPSRRNIGYSIKITLDNQVTKEIDLYFNFYDICEIKLSEDNLLSPYFPDFLHHVKTFYFNRVSFHLPNDILVNIGQYKTYLALVQQSLIEYDTRYIVHYSNLLSEHHIFDHLNYLRQYISANSIILLENDKKTTPACFEQAFHICTRYTSGQIGICFDLGHAILNNLNCIDERISFYFTNPSYAQYIYEVHIHNVINGIDHQPFDLNKNNIDQIKCILAKHNRNSYIIFEIKNISPLSRGGFLQTLPLVSMYPHKARC